MCLRDVPQPARTSEGKDAATSAHIETHKKSTAQRSNSLTFEGKAKEMTIRERRAYKQTSKQHKQAGLKSP